MKSYPLSHLNDPALLGGLKAVLARERKVVGPIIAEVLAYIGEVDSRKLYREAAYPCMRSYCVGELELTEDAASKRIQAARVARRFPVLLDALTDGRLHLTAVNLLAPHLTPENVDALVGAAAGKKKSEIERLLAERFPGTELLPLVETLSSSVTASAAVHGKAVSGQHAPAHVERVAPRPKATPIAKDRFAVEFSMGKEMHDDLCEAQELLGHQVPSGDIAQVLHRGLKALIRDLKKRKFGATDKPRNRQRPVAPAGRYVPADVRRAVSERDGGQCTYESASGRRCTARTMLEFDHIEPVARGGKSTAENLRLRCRTHNQYEAERTFGQEFMNDRREQARMEAKRRARAAEEERKQAALREQTEDLISGLRNLGYPAGQARRAAECSGSKPDASLEERMRAALSWFRPRPYSVSRAVPTP